MKKLLVLLILWLITTVHLAYNNHILNEYKKDDLQRRAFIVYSRTLSSCMVGIEYAKPMYDFYLAYSFCMNKAYYDKDFYLKEWGSK